MSQYSSFAKISEQIVNYNNNVLQLISSLNSIYSSNSSAVTVNLSDNFGVLQTYNIPSIGYLLSEIQRLNNNINTLYAVNNSGNIIQSATNKYQKIITVDINQEPATLSSLSVVSKFNSKQNFFFDSLMDPSLTVNIDLTNQVGGDVMNALVRRYIVIFDKNTDGTLTPNGQAALTSFNNLYRNQANINYDDFNYWLSTTPAIGNSSFEESLTSFDPNELLYTGYFTVLSTYEDRLNNKLWYNLDTLNYTVTSTGDIKQLAVGDQVIINMAQSNSRFSVIEINTSSSNYQARFQIIEGNQPIPVAVNSLKIYSPLVMNKVLEVPIGYNERNVIFVKPMNTGNNLLAMNWSPGSGYWTNDLVLTSTDAFNGTTMDTYYTNVVNDYGAILQDLVTKKIPNKNGIVPNAPILTAANFTVVQNNKHLTNNVNSNLLLSKNNTQKQLKSQLTQVDNAINSKQQQAKILKFPSVAAQTQFNNELNDLIATKNTKSSLLSSTVTDILNISQANLTNVKAKYDIRGFWIFPTPVLTSGTGPQQVVQFRIQYRYLSTDGQENPINSLRLVDTSGNVTANAVLPNWKEIKSDVAQRVKDSNGNLVWQTQDVTSIDQPTINQIALPLQQGERIEIRVKSLSEVGWPEAPIESDWSNILTYDFPDSLNTVTNTHTAIITEANNDNLRSQISSDYTAKGLDNVLNNVVTINNKTYTGSADAILSGFKDPNGLTIDLYTYLNNLSNTIADLQQQIQGIKGIMVVSIFRNNDQFIVKNNSEVEFTVECEDYLESYTATGVPTGRVYSNDVYVVKDFLLRISNTAVSSPLGLLSDRTYYVNSPLFNTAAPQIFWVNDRDEFLFNQSTGSTRTQLDNQFLWSINYEVVNQTTVTQLAGNIGNSFQTNNSNSLVNVLSTTEFNLGYSDPSLLSFVGSNNSILEMQKWTDTVLSVSSNNKLLTSVHPVISTLETLVQTQNNNVEVINAGSNNDIVIPINIYFKLNSIDPNSGNGANYQYVNLNNSQTTIKHIKKVEFLLENEADNRPFIFTVKFNINRNKLVIQKITPSTKTTISSKA